MGSRRGRSVLRSVVVFAAVLVAGCGGGAHNAMLPVAQSEASPLLAAVSAMATYPQSQSPASFTVAPMPQTPRLPASAMADAFRGVAPQSIGPLNFSRLSGSAVSVAVGPDGSIWALSPTPAAVNKSIWHYVSGTWTNISGSAASIAVGPTGTLYAVNGTTGGVYAYNGSSWSSLGGGARWVTTGADGAVYVLSNNHVVNGNSAIYKYANATWSQQPGSGSQLAGSLDPGTYAVTGVGTVAPNGYFVLNSSGGIYYYSPGIGYVRFPGAASGIAPLIGGFIALKYPAAAGGEGLFYFDYLSAGATSEPGTGIALTAGVGSGGSGTQLDIVNASNAIYTTPVTLTGNIYVADTFYSTVAVFSAAGTPLYLITAGLADPAGVAVDVSGKIYVTNYSANTVTTYTANGAPTTPTIATKASPNGVAVDASGKIYVTNDGDSTVNIYNAAGTLLNTIRAGLSDPACVAVDASGKVYVANFGNNTVTTYTAAGVQTTPTITIPDGTVEGVAVDAAGRIYVANPTDDSVTTYNPDGTPASLKITGLNAPENVVVDAAGKIYVANAEQYASSVTVYNANGMQISPLITTDVNQPIGLAVH